ncbi:MAG: SAM-dependent methyltransferase [Mycobacteriales bacterium]
MSPDRTAARPEVLAAPPGVDITKASIARVYDYVLGGKDNFAVDRAAAQAFLRVIPEAALIARDNRSFVRRAVRFLVGDARIRQIIDIGSGLPTEGNVHEIAHEIDPSTRVVYVDKDPIVLAHGRALLADRDNSTVITADIRQPDSIFDNPAVAGHIDRGEPLAIIVSGLLHHLSDDEDPWGVAAAIRNWLPSGSFLVITNFFDPGEPRARAVERAFIDGGLGTGRFRTMAEQSDFFAGLDLVEPGLVLANDWHPDVDTATDSPVHSLYLAGIGRKP